MDRVIKNKSLIANHYMKQQIKTTTKRVDNPDGSYEEIRVEEVIGGFIKTVTKHFKEDEEWKWEDEKSVHMENPLEEKDLASKLEEFLKNR
jgi:hypothetical protein